VKERVERCGDPRNPGADPVDCVERIPFSETCSYVQRIIENIEVNRARFGGGTKLAHRGRHPPRRQHQLMTASGVSRFVTAPDGLRLRVPVHGERGSRHLPAVCLCDAVHAAAYEAASNPAVNAC
jgi:hypothetical protein